MIILDGYNVSRTQKLQDFTAPLGVSLSAVGEETWIRSPVSSIDRNNELNKATLGEIDPFSAMGGIRKRLGPDTPIISKKDADLRISESGVKLEIGEDGIPDAALNILIERKREEVKRKALIEAAPPGFWSGAAQIGTGLAVSMADPINVASAFIPIIGQSRYARLVAGATDTAGRAGVRAGLGAVEGFVGAAIVEPIVLLASKGEQADYGLYDSFLNLAFGAVLGGGLHSGVGAIGDAIGRSSPQLKEDLLRAATARAMDDQPIDIAYIAKTDSSFREEWRASELDAVMRGADVDPRVKAEFNQVMDELRPELMVRAGELPDGVSAKAIADLEAGRVPHALIDDVARVVKSRIEDFDAPPPRINAKSPEASEFSAREADQTIKESIEASPESLDKLTDDILVSLEEQDFNTTALRAEISEINASAEVDAKGLREFINCRLGK